MQTLWLFVTAVLFVVLQAAIFARSFKRSVHYDRYFLDHGAFCGETVELHEIVENRSFLPKPYVVVESRISTSLAFRGEQADHTVSSEMYHRSLFFLRPYSRLTRKHPVELRQRGYYEVGSVAITSGDLLSLSQVTNQLSTGAAIAVYPRMLSNADIPLPCQRLIGEITVRRFTNPDRALINGIRPYQVGDAPNDVHWAASARAGELLVKRYDYSAAPTLLVLFNVQCKKGQWDRLSEDERERVELNVSLCASLCMQAIESGIKTGFCANTTLSGAGDEDCTIAPACSSAHANDLMLLFARMTLVRTHNFHTFLSQLQIAPGTDILILTPYTDEDIDNALTALRARHASVSVHFLQGGVHVA